MQAEDELITALHFLNPQHSSTSPDEASPSARDQEEQAALPANSSQAHSSIAKQLSFDADYSSPPGASGTQSAASARDVVD
jgi:hypothetical protein